MQSESIENSTILNNQDSSKFEGESRPVVELTEDEEFKIEMSLRNVKTLELESMPEKRFNEEDCFPKSIFEHI